VFGTNPNYPPGRKFFLKNAYAKGDSRVEPLQKLVVRRPVVEDFSHSPVRRAAPAPLVTTRERPSNLGKRARDEDEKQVVESVKENKTNTEEEAN
jgi:hypothetical protein